jgi:hypothetical protein
MNKVKTLFLAAYPDVSPLKLDEEIRAITQKIRAAEYRDTIDLVSAWAVRPDDLLQTFNEHKPHIVHFSGHGSPSGEIILVDENLVNGKRVSKSVSPVAIKALFQTFKDNVQVVLLNACYSRIQAEAIRDVIDCVIGMNTAIGDQAAITFAASFYRALGFGRSVKEAFEQGKVALLLENIPENNTPELLCKPGIDPAQVFLIGYRSDSNTEQVSSRISPIELPTPPTGEKITMNKPLVPSPLKTILPQDLLLKITVPAGFDIRGPNSFSNFSKWLSYPLREGDNPGSFEYPIEGQVLPKVLGLTVKISIHTNQWWEQGRFLVRADGTFSGTVFLDQRLERAIFRFDILNNEGDSLKYFDVTVT